MQRLDERQASPYGALRRILVGIGIAKVDQEPIAVVLGNVAIKGLHGPFAGCVERLQGGSKVVGIEALQAGGSHQTAA